MRWVLVSPRVGAGSGLFDSVDEITGILEIFPSVFSAVEFNREAISESVESGSICAQAMAEYLVMKGVAFRVAHEIVGRIIRDNETFRKKMQDNKLSDLKTYSESFGPDVIPLLVPEGVVKQLATYGSAGTVRYEQQLRMAYEAAEE